VGFAPGHRFSFAFFPGGGGLQGFWPQKKPFPISKFLQPFPTAGALFFFSQLALLVCIFPAAFGRTWHGKNDWGRGKKAGAWANPHRFSGDFFFKGGYFSGPKLCGVGKMRPCLVWRSVWFFVGWGGGPATVFEKKRPRVPGGQGDNGGPLRRLFRVNCGARGGGTGGPGLRGGGALPKTLFHSTKKTPNFLFDLGEIFFHAGGISPGGEGGTEGLGPTKRDGKRAETSKGGAGGKEEKNGEKGSGKIF